MKNNDKLFEIENIWDKHWKDMPSFSMTPEVPILTIKVSFKTEEDIKKFGELIGQKINYDMENYWFPKLNRKSFSDKKYGDRNEP
jgi:hypothetical protein